MVTKTIDPKKWVGKGTEFAGEFRKFCKAEEIQFYSTMSNIKAAFAECSIRPLKIYFTMTIMDTSTFKNYLNFSKPWILGKIDQQIWYQKMSRIPTFCSFCTARHYESLKNPSLKVKAEYASSSISYLSGRFISHSLDSKFLILLQFCLEHLQHTHKRMNKTRLSVLNFIKKS